MKIVQINTNRVNNALGGAERVFFSLANALAQHGHQVVNLYLDRAPGNPIFEVDSRVCVKNCWTEKAKWIFKWTKIWFNVRYFYLVNRKKVSRMAFLQKVLYKEVVRSVKHFNPDVVILYYPSSILRMLRDLKIPTITMLHMSIEHLKIFPDFLEIKESLALSDCIQVLMPEFKDELYSVVSHSNIMHIPNVVPQYNECADYFVKKIIFVGRLVEVKRPWLVPEAFALLKSRYPDWIVEMWGEAHVEEVVTRRVQRCIRDYDLADCVHICGTALDIPTKLQTSSIFLMPSKSEGFPLATTEGMSMGLAAVVCKDCPSHNTLVRNGENGFLCEPTPEDIAEKLSILMKDVELRRKLGRQAKSDMKAYAPKGIYDRWESLLKKMRKKNDI